MMKGGLQTSADDVRMMAGRDMMVEIEDVVAHGVAEAHMRLDRMFLGIPLDDPRMDEMSMLERELRMLEARE